MIPILARAVREIESAVERGQAVSVRSRFQAVALLAREERIRVRTDTTLTEAKRDGELKRLDGIATILAQTAAREPSFFTLLSDTAKVSDQASEMRRAMLERAGFEVAEEEETDVEQFPLVIERRVVPQSVLARQLSNPFLPPDFTAVSQNRGQARRLAGWELLGPLFRSFEEVGNGAATSMPLPEPREVMLPGALELMKHQAEVVASAADGHRTFLLADEPGLGKTAQALLAAEAVDAFPLLAVVPNVVKMNWSREASIWVPH
ncbi:MAG: ATP-dependent helicase, partial [Nocardioides sp.]